MINKWVEMMTHRITLALGVIAFVGGGIAFLDGRHASAGDVQELTQMLRMDRVGDLEFQIEEVERRISHILFVPEVDRTPWQVQELHDLQSRKERYIRKLERLNE